MKCKILNFKNILLLKKTLLFFYIVVVLIIISFYFIKVHRLPQKEKEIDISINLEKNKNNKHAFYKTLQDFLVDGIDHGFNYEDLKKVSNFYYKNRENESIRKDLLYYFPFISSQKIIHEYTNNINNLDQNCQDISDLFTLQEHPDNRGGNISTDIHLNTEVGLKVLSISYKCKDQDNFNNLFDKAVTAVNANILYGQENIFLWYYDEDRIESNIKWLSDIFGLDMTELKISDESPDAIRIFLLDKNFEPVKYKQFKSNENSGSLYKYKYNKGTFYIKEDKLFWKDTNQLVLE